MSAGPGTQPPRPQKADPQKQDPLGEADTRGGGDDARGVPASAESTGEAADPLATQIGHPEGGRNEDRDPQERPPGEAPA